MTKTEEEDLIKNLKKRCKWITILNAVLYLIIFIGSFYDPYMTQILKVLNGIYFAWGILTFGPVIIIGFLELLELKRKGDL